jgi:hypothetical protein
VDDDLDVTVLWLAHAGGGGHQQMRLAETCVSISAAACIGRSYAKSATVTWFAQNSANPI